MNGKLQVGVIGCGSIGLRHIHGYLACGRYEVAALADTRPEAIAEFDRAFAGREDYGPRRYDDAAAMLEAEDLDVVSVSTWHRGHAPWTIAAAASGVRAVLCEKPMAEDLGRAQEMRDVCDANGVKLVIGHQRRFLPAYNLARDLVAQGAVGDVQLMRGFSDDGLLNWGSHLLDMFRYVLDDECEWVMGGAERKTDRYERDVRVEDRALGVFGFRGGATAMLLSGLDRDFYQGGVIYGSDGIIELWPDRLRLLNGDTKGTWGDRVPEGRFFSLGDEGYEYLEGCSAQADELADWVEGKVESHRGEATNGYRALEMAFAVLESARRHERVELPLDTTAHPLDLMVESGHMPVTVPGRYDIRRRAWMEGDRRLV